MNIRKPISLTLAAIWMLAAGCSGSAAPSDSQTPTEIAVMGPTAVNGSSEQAPPSPGPTLETTAAASEESVETAVPLPTPTFGPTPLPPPFQGQSVMGIELIGENFGSLAGAAASAGAYWVRWNAIFWSAVEPVQGSRDWSALAAFEQQILSLAASNLVPIVIVRSTPEWAQSEPGSYCGRIVPDALDDFASFMSELVSRYSGPPYNIKYWELWNEPDIDPRLVPGDQIFGCWGDEDDPFYGGGGYAEMLKAVYPGIKQADPLAQVLVGGLLMDCDPVNPPETAPGSGIAKNCTPSRFLEGILEGGGGDFFDGVSFHAYDFYDVVSGFFSNANWHSGFNLNGLSPVLIAKTRYIKSVLALYGHSDKYLINTETSLLCGRTGDEAECNTGAHLSMKTDYVVMSYAAAIAEGLAGNVWFTLDKSWRRSALTLDNGSPTTALIAYNFASMQFEGATFWGNVAEFAGVNGYKFRRDGLEFWVVWSSDGLARMVELGELPTAIYNSIGAPLQPDQALELTGSPIYLVFGP